MIIQREIEAVMLAIDKLIEARIGMYDAATGAALACGDAALRATESVRRHTEIVTEARIEICDALKDVIRTATGEDRS